MGGEHGERGAVGDGQLIKPEGQEGGVRGRRRTADSCTDSSVLATCARRRRGLGLGLGLGLGPPRPPPPPPSPPMPRLLQ